MKTKTERIVKKEKSSISDIFMRRSKVFNIKFKGQKLVLVGTRKDGAIATKKQFESFSPSLCHLYPDGKIKMHGIEIGTIKDIKFLD